MAAQAFTNFSASNGAANQPTSYVAADGFTGPITAPMNLNSPTFGAATFPGGIAAGTVIHGAEISVSIPLAVTAVTNTDLTATIPTGAIIKSMTVYTTATFTGNTSSVTLAVGSAAAGAQYVAAVSISTIGILSLTLLASATTSLLSFPAGSPNLFLRLNQAAAATAVGAGTLVVTYVLP